MTYEEHKAEMRRLYQKPQSQWSEQDWEDFEFANQSYEDWQRTCDDNGWEDRR